MEERHAARVAAAVAGAGSGGVPPPASVTTGRRVLTARDLLVYLAEPDQIDVDDFNFLGFWSRRGTDSVCPTTDTVMSPAEMPYLAFLTRLYHGVYKPPAVSRAQFISARPPHWSAARQHACK